MTYFWWNRIKLHFLVPAVCHDLCAKTVCEEPQPQCGAATVKHQRSTHLYKNHFIYYKIKFLFWYNIMELVFSSSLRGLQALGTAIHTLNKWQPFTTKFSQNSFVFFFFLIIPEQDTTYCVLKRIAILCVEKQTYILFKKH